MIKNVKVSNLFIQNRQILALKHTKKSKLYQMYENIVKIFVNLRTGTETEGISLIESTI